MLVLFETASGFALFKLLNEKKLKSIDNLYEDFETPEKAGQILQMQHFQKFSDTTEALAAITGVIEGKMSKSLKKLMKKIDVGEQLALADAKLGSIIKEKTGVQCVSSAAINELIRCIRQQTDSLLPQLASKDLTAMRLGLAHSLSRYRLKFSPDKVDTMIVQAVSLLDDLDKELNNYVMRCREWYGWHFPELGKLIADNLTYVKVVDKMGVRTNAIDTDLSDLLPEDVENAVKKSAEISMGTEIADEDMINIRSLCDQIKDINEYRASLNEYLKNRMMAVAPNLSVLVGDIVGARLISHAGSLMSLAKHPASTVQILGAEKALFRALKTKHDTPKYGLIYHAQFVTQASQKLKGKASRMLATKAALACRIDALGETADTTAELGVQHRSKLESRLRQLEDGVQHRVSSTGRRSAAHDTYSNFSVVKKYNDAADSTVTGSVKRRFEDGEHGFPKNVSAGLDASTTDGADESGTVADLDGSYVQSKKKRRVQSESGEQQQQEDEQPADSGTVQSGAGDAATSKPKKKKKKHQQDQEDAGEESGVADDSAALNSQQEEQSPQKKAKKKRKQSESAVETSEAAVEQDAVVEKSSEKKKKKRDKSASAVVAEADEETPQGVAPSSEGKKKKKKKSVSEE